MSASYYTRLSFPGFLSLKNVGNSCFMNVAALAMKHAPIRMWPCPGAVESGMVALLRSLRRGIPVDRDALELAREEIGADSGTLHSVQGVGTALRSRAPLFYGGPPGGNATARRQLGGDSPESLR